MDIRHWSLRAALHVSAGLLFLTPSLVRAQAQADPRIAGKLGSVVIPFGAFKLTLVSTDPDLSKETANNVANTFQAVMPAECAFFNNACPHNVTITIEAQTTCGNETEVGGCAWIEGGPDNGFMLINGKGLRANPQDYDMVTHEAMHLVQGYDWGALGACKHWYEGEADLARAWFGVNNPAANWRLPTPEATKDYTTSYKDTAAFLNWIFTNWSDGPIRTLHQTLQNKQCPGPDIWAEATKFKTIDALFQGYLANNATPPPEPETAPIPPDSPLFPPPSEPEPTEPPNSPGEPSIPVPPDLPGDPSTPVPPNEPVEFF